jgi:NitT/TauT family transport system substrate-binding protein
MFSMRTVLCTALIGALVAWTQPAAQAQTKPAPVNVRVATFPIANFAQLVVARDKGWFAEENLSVTWSAVAQGSVAVEAVYGGSAEFGGTAILEPMIARGNGLDVSFAVATSRVRNAPPDNSAFMVRADDNIREAKDLVGKTISAGLVNSVNYIHMQDWLQKRGVDPKTVTFLEIPFPQMADALFAKRLDAVWNVEPFVSIMMRSGKVRILAHPMLENQPGMDITAFVAKDSWLEANADVARRFKRAIDRSTAHLNSAPKEERDGWVAKFTGVKPEMVSAMNLPQFSSEFRPASLSANLDLAVRQKVVKPFDVNVMIWKP